MPIFWRSKRLFKKIVKSTCGFVLINSFLLSLSFCQRGTSIDFNDRQSSGILTKKNSGKEAIVQVYAARAARWRGYVAVHSWIAFKKENESSFYVAQIVGWRLKRGLSALSLEKDIPDRKWFGAPAELLEEIRGGKASSAIRKIEAIATAYPYAKSYRVWPGPNSNTFISYLIRELDELTVELPPNAIGKDWLISGLFAKSESGTGLQLSLRGALGLTIGWAEGFELNLLGLCFGIDLRRPALKLPFIGRIGLKDTALGS